MTEDYKKYGLLITKDIKLHRSYFKQMVKLLGINCLYYAPLPGKHFDRHGDLETDYYKPELVGCIFQDHPDQKTLKKLGWVAELQENSSIIFVEYDLPKLQVGALFELPSGIEGAPGRMFRVINMRTTMIYPASIACEIVPEYFDTDDKVLTKNFEDKNFTVLIDHEEDD